MTGFLSVRNIFVVCKMLLLSIKLHLDLNCMWPAQVHNFLFDHRVRILLITLAIYFPGTMCIVISIIAVYNTNCREFQLFFVLVVKRKTVNMG